MPRLSHSAHPNPPDFGAVGRQGVMLLVVSMRLRVRRGATQGLAPSQRKGRALCLRASPGGCGAALLRDAAARVPSTAAQGCSVGAPLKRVAEHVHRIAQALGECGLRGSAMLGRVARTPTMPCNHASC